MRKLKFRAWDKERNEMRDVQLMDWSDWWVSTGRTWERDNALEYGERNSFQNKETDRHILMQYTGLKDKNSKEIYEGDVVRHGQDAPRTVTYHKATFVCINRNYTNEWGTALWDYVLDGIEVIGNIYENSDLLEDHNG